MFNLQIADFGLSNVFKETSLLSTFCGSPLYASPEIVKGTPYIGPEVSFAISRKVHILVFLSILNKLNKICFFISGRLLVIGSPTLHSSLRGHAI